MDNIKGKHSLNIWPTTCLPKTKGGLRYTGLRMLRASTKGVYASDPRNLAWARHHPKAFDFHGRILLPGQRRQVRAASKNALRLRRF